MNLHVVLYSAEDMWSSHDDHAVVNLHNGSISSKAAEMRSDETLKGGLIDVAGGAGRT